MRDGIEKARKDRKEEMKITQDTSISIYLESKVGCFHIDTMIWIIILTDPEKQFYIL